METKPVTEPSEPSDAIKEMRRRMGQCTKCGEMPDECSCQSAKALRAGPSEPSAEAFQRKDLSACNCGWTSLIDLNLHHHDCAQRLTHEHNCMVTHNYYRKG
jgi:hypothetical protein